MPAHASTASALDTSVTGNSFRPAWDPDTGRGLDPQGLSQWQALNAALVLVKTIAGTVEYGPAFTRHVDAVRRGADPETIAARSYVPRNTSSRRRRVIARILEVAAGEEDGSARRSALIRLCQPPTTARDLYADDTAVPAPQDRQSSLQERWRRTVADGARLIALRGSERCLACEHELEDSHRVHLGGPTSGRRVRADYCDRCEGGPADQLRDWRRKAIEQVLKGAEPTILNTLR